jgi:hypothetical protein
MKMYTTSTFNLGIWLWVTYKYVFNPYKFAFSVQMVRYLMCWSPFNLQEIKNIILTTARILVMSD